MQSKLIAPEKLFDRIAPGYFITDWLSFGLTSHVRKQVIRKVLFPQESSVIDLMCGPGNNIKPLQLHLPNGFSYTGFDFAANMVHLGRQKFSEVHRVKFTKTNVLQDELPKTEASLLLCSFGIKCINPEKYETFVQIADNLLSKTGRFAIVEFQFPQAFLPRLLVKLYLLTVFRLCGLIAMRSIVPVRELLTRLKQPVNTEILSKLFTQMGFEIMVERRYYGSVLMLTGQRKRT